MIDAIIHLCSSIISIEKITSLLESLFIFWIIVSKHSMNIISSTLSSKNHMYCHVWCLNVNVKNFKFNLHHLNSAQIWLRFCLDLTQTSYLYLTQMWLKCILVSLMHHHVKMCLISSRSDLTQMWLRSILVLLMHHHVKMHLISSRSNLIQMWLRFILVSSVHHHVKMYLISFCSSDILLRSDSNVIQIYSSLVCASSH